MRLIWIGGVVIAAGLASSFLGHGPAPAKAAIWIACIVPWVALGYAAGLGCGD